MNITKQPEQEIQWDMDGNPFVIWGKTLKLGLDQFHREVVRFIDPEREYWHGMDCTRDLVIHISKCGSTAVLGRVKENSK